MTSLRRISAMAAVDGRVADWGNAMDTRRVAMETEDGERPTATMDVEFEGWVWLMKVKAEDQRSRVGQAGN